MNETLIEDILSAMRAVGTPAPGEDINEIARRADMLRLFLPQAAQLGPDEELRARDLADELTADLRAVIRASIRGQGVHL